MKRRADVREDGDDLAAQPVQEQPERLPDGLSVDIHGMHTVSHGTLLQTWPGHPPGSGSVSLSPSEVKRSGTTAPARARFFS
jgi:hypothetical protein